MSKTMLSFFAVVLCALCFFLTGMSSPRQKIIGTVKIFGSEPHTYALIQNEQDGKNYAVDNSKKEKELHTLQGRRIEWTVKIISTNQVFPPADGLVSIISYKEI